MCTYARFKDPLRFADIVRAIEPLVTNLVRPWAHGSWDRINELKQAALIDLARKGHSYPCELPPVVYIKQVTRSAVISQYRRDKAYLSTFVTGLLRGRADDHAGRSAGFVDCPTSFSDDPVENAIFNECLQRANEALREITPQQARIWELRKKTDAQIAAELKISLQAVRASRHLTKQRLLQAMGITVPRRPRGNMNDHHVSSDGGPPPDIGTDLTSGY
jgi:RNA polymerase sigma factor (sigma-70 family)